MQRTASIYLQNWLKSKDRKPLIIRGARQIGKTWLVRNFIEMQNRVGIELNLEKNPQLASLFNSNNPQQILLNLNAALNITIHPEQSLLFLDEIQACPELLSKLRWFAEEMPELPVIATGSLLEFVLEDHSFSMPVGRITYLHLEPLSFQEFLLAQEKKSLYDYLHHYNINQEIPEVIHQQLITLFKEYLIIGGLPAAVSSWIQEKNLNKISQIQHDLIATYRDDFSKYHKRIARERLDEVMLNIPKMLGQKFVFSRINNTVQAAIIKQAVSLLNKARVSHRISACAANGIPLGAETNEKYFKEIFIDTGLCCTSLGLNLNHISTTQDITLINQGGIAEQVTGQLLRTINQPYIEPSLYYWQREEKNSNAEIDYIIQHAHQIVPIEVKAGSTGGLKSLHLFMQLKKLPLAIRINSDIPSKTEINVKTQLGQLAKYSLLSLPFYLIEQIPRFLSL